MENTLHIIPQVVCTLFQCSGAKFPVCGDSLRTGIEKGLLHNSNAIFHFCFKYSYMDRSSIGAEFDSGFSFFSSKLPIYEYNYSKRADGVIREKCRNVKHIRIWELMKMRDLLMKYRELSALL